MKIGDFTLLKSIGKGEFGEVFLTSREGTQERYATKRMIRKYVDRPKSKKYFDNELSIIKEVNHKNIVKLIDFKENETFYYLVFELCNGGGLSTCLEKYQHKYHTPFTEEIVQYLMRQIMDAMKYLHERNILHRDLKTDNILVHFDSEEDKNNLNMLKCHVKIIDFGFARYLPKGQVTQSVLGSPIYMDPVILNKLVKKSIRIEEGRDQRGGYDEKADIWSLGGITYELSVGESPFEARTVDALVKKVGKGIYYLPVTLSKEIASFIINMLKSNSSERYSANTLTKHKFLLGNVKSFTPINRAQVNHLLSYGQIEVKIDNSHSIFSDQEERAMLMLGNNSEENKNNFERKCSAPIRGPSDLSGNNRGITRMASGPQNDRFSKKVSGVNVLKGNNNNYRDRNAYPVNYAGNTGNEEDRETLKLLINAAYEEMNGDFICDEPMLLPIVPGDEENIGNDYEVD